MKLSARNAMSGTIVELVKGATTATVKLQVAPGLVITSSITNEAVDALGLQKGRSALAIIKSSDVILAVDDSD